MADESRISPYNLTDCKNTTDEALQNYLISLPSFRQSHFYADVKLAIGYTAVIISAITFAYDYKLGFDATKHWTLYTVIAYFVLNGAFTYWIWAVEKGLVFTGDWKGRKITISSRVDKFDPTYRLAVTYNKDPSTTSNTERLELEAPFMQWFTADGFFVAKPFQQWLATSISLIGEADPKNLVQGAADAPVDATSTAVNKTQAKLSKRKP